MAACVDTSHLYLQRRTQLRTIADGNKEIYFQNQMPISPQTALFCFATNDNPPRTHGHATKSTMNTNSRNHQRVYTDPQRVRRKEVDRISYAKQKRRNCVWIVSICIFHSRRATPPNCGPYFKPSSTYSAPLSTSSPIGPPRPMGARGGLIDLVK